MTSFSCPRRPDATSGVPSDYEVALAANSYWAAQDVEMTASMLAENVIYKLYVNRSAKPVCIERVGRAAVRSMMYDVLEDFDYPSYEFDILEADQGVVRIQARYTLLHRASGEELHCSKRFICAVRDGLFTRIHEFQDAPLVEAFLKLAKWRLKEEQAALLATARR